MARFIALGGASPVHVEVTPTAGLFTSTGGTWTVAPADVATFEYLRLGSLIHFDVDLTGGTIAGNPSELLIQIPFTVPQTTTGFLVIDPTGNPSGGMVIIQQNTNQFRLRPLAGNWTNGVTPLAFEITFSLT